MRDVAHVRDGYAPQTNIVRVNGQRGVAPDDPEERQRLDARRSCRRCAPMLPQLAGRLPPELQVTQLFDQSLFVRAVDRRRA